MFAAEALILGAVAAFVVGVSKTGVPGGGILAVPLLASVFEGRQIAGGTLPILIVADLFAVGWYRRHARWDVIARIAPWIGAGYALGIAFFIIVGSAERPIEIAIGTIVLAIVVIQAIKLLRQANAARPDTTTQPEATPQPQNTVQPDGVRPPSRGGEPRPQPYGAGAGFTTFVANAAGPVLNSYLIGRRLTKAEMLGTSAILYFAINLSKIPFYVALGEFTDGGRFFSWETLGFDLAVVPAIGLGVLAGRALFHRISQGAFVWTVLVLSAAGALNLLL